MLDDILAMLDELSWSLPRFRAYEETLPMNKALESALLDVYTEMICFCARTIGFLRSTTHRMLSFYPFRLGQPLLMPTRSINPLGLVKTQ